MCLAILLSESPLFTVYVVPPVGAAGASDDAPAFTSEKSALPLVPPGVDDDLLVVSEKSGLMLSNTPIVASVWRKESMPERQFVYPFWNQVHEPRQWVKARVRR